jgi:ribosomal protein S18 acetylase RimI-like enzyme
VHLEVEPDKDRALELYLRRGFVDKKRRLMTKVL